MLATASANTNSGTENVGLASANGEETLSPEGYENKAGGTTSTTGQEVGESSGWGTFVPMGAIPSPDVVCLVRKKGWAARQQQEQQQLQRPGQSTQAGTAAGDSLRSRVPGTYGQVKKHRTRQKARAAVSSPVRQAAEGGAGKRNRSDFAAAGSPGKRLNEHHQTRTALNAAPSNGTNRSNNRLQEGEGRSIDKTRDRTLSRQYASPPNEDGLGNVEANSRLSRQHLPMPDCLASPPRLSRAREGGIPALSSGWSSPTAPRLDDTVPLGLSTPGGGNRKSTAKVGCNRVWATPGHSLFWVCVDSKEEAAYAGSRLNASTLCSFGKYFRMTTSLLM